MKKRLLMMVYLTAFVLQAQATTYYINDNVVEAGSLCSVVGNDGNNGLTPATPKTLNYVNAGGAIQAGDIVYIDKGLYSNIWNCGGGLGAGTALNHIRFIGVDSTSTIIQGTAGPGGMNAINFACLPTNTNLYWDFSNLAVSGVGMPALNIGDAGRNFSYVTFTNCLIKSQGNAAIFLQGNMANWTFTGSKIQSDQICINMGGGAADINNTFENCRISHIANNASTMIAIGNGTRNDNKFNKCTITNAGNGFIFDFPGGNYLATNITNCQIRGNGSSEAVHIGNGCALIGFQFTNNYISNVVTGIGCGNPGQGEMNITNNSFYTSGNCLGNAGTGGYFKDATIRNNIFHTTGAAAVSAVLISGNTSNPTVSNYNQYYTPSGARVGTHNSVAKTTLVDWQNTFNSNDANSASGDPLYTSAGTGDLSIPCSSPAFKTGVATALTTDIFGSTRPAMPSIGAYENTTTVTITASPTAPSFCPGGSTSITASGATTYAWSPATNLDATTGATVTANPTATITYTITGTASGCTGTTTVTVTVHDLPTISVSPASPSVCAGSSVDLTASGADTYAWSPATDLDATTGATVESTPSADRTYTITGTDANTCTNTTTVTVTINDLPTISVSPAAPAVCAGSSVDLTASGGTSYTWSPATDLDATTGATVESTPSVDRTYTVTGTDANNCSNTATVTVTVNALPTAPTLAAFADLCSTAAAITLTGGAPAGGTYTGTGVSTGSFDPAAAGTGSHTITYTITDLNLCSNSATGDIAVNICSGVNDQANAIATSVYPNPNDGSFLLTFDPKKSGSVEMILLNAQGKEQYRNKLSIPAGQSSEKFAMDLTPGLYQLQLIYEGSTYHEKIVVR